MQGEPDESAELEDAPDPDATTHEPTAADGDPPEAEAPEGEPDADAADLSDAPEVEADDELEADLPDDIEDEFDADEELAPELEAEPAIDEAIEGPPPVAYEPWAPPRRRHKWLARLLVPFTVLIPAVVIFTVVKQATSTDEKDEVDTRLADKLRYDGDGNPVVLAPALGLGPTKSRQWRVCGAECDKVSGRGADFRPGEVLAGSRVEVKVVAERGTADVVTPGWDGQLRLINRPTLTGSPAIGSTITANPGKWTGGWLGATTQLGIRACPTQAGGGKCIAFTASILDRSQKPVRSIPASFKGWWIGAIEWQVPPGRTFRAANFADPKSPEGAEPAPLRSIAVATGPLDGPIR
ncbi:MAG: hypothetical protein J7513_10460 [Solirubrobacteraceae bacterium]|nr:hypothetical protein [Solirubrobacteraceae bacterium]